MTYESRLLKYATRGFAIGLSRDLMDPARLDTPAFERADILGSAERAAMRASGLGRLVLADRVSPFNEVQRSSTKKSLQQ